MHESGRYLVTGCAGFIGSHLTESLLADGNEVVGVGHTYSVVTTKTVTTTVVQPQKATSSTIPTSLGGRGLSVNQIYKQAGSGVVDILVTDQTSTPFGGSQQSQGEGAGVVYDNKGDVVAGDPRKHRLGACMHCPPGDRHVRSWRELLDEQVLRDARTGYEAEVLVHEGQPEGVPFRRRQRELVLLACQDEPCRVVVRCVVAGQHLDQGRLAGAVGTEQTVDRAGRKTDRDIAEDAAVAEALADVRDLDDITAGGRRGHFTPHSLR